MYKFKKPKNTNHRSTFANRVLKLIYEKCEGNLDKAIILAEPFFEDFDENLRNVYQFIDSEIPLWAYHHLLKTPVEDLDMTAATQRKPVFYTTHKNHIMKTKEDFKAPTKDMPLLSKTSFYFSDILMILVGKRKYKAVYNFAKKRFERWGSNTEYYWFEISEVVGWKLVS